MERIHSITFSLELPFGFEIIAYRKPQKGELFLYADGEMDTATFDFEEDYCMIVQKAG